MECERTAESSFGNNSCDILLSRIFRYWLSSCEIASEPLVEARSRRPQKYRLSNRAPLAECAIFSMRRLCSTSRFPFLSGDFAFLFGVVRRLASMVGTKTLAMTRSCSSLAPCETFPTSEFTCVARRPNVSAKSKAFVHFLSMCEKSICRNGSC